MPVTKKKESAAAAFTQISIFQAKIDSRMKTERPVAIRSIDINFKNEVHYANYIVFV